MDTPRRYLRQLILKVYNISTIVHNIYFFIFDHYVHCPEIKEGIIKDKSFLLNKCKNLNFLSFCVLLAWKNFWC